LAQKWLGTPCTEARFGVVLISGLLDSSVSGLTGHFDRRVPGCGHGSEDGPDGYCRAGSYLAR
jgi:hypothetical protein